jgi:hypothetical protein
VIDCGVGVDVGVGVEGVAVGVAGVAVGVGGVAVGVDGVPVGVGVVPVVTVSATSSTKKSLGSELSVVPWKYT